MEVSRDTSGHNCGRACKAEVHQGLWKAEVGHIRSMAGARDGYQQQDGRAPGKGTGRDMERTWQDCGEHSRIQQGQRQVRGRGTCRGTCTGSGRGTAGAPAQAPARPRQGLGKTWEGHGRATGRGTGSGTGVGTGRDKE